MRSQSLFSLSMAALLAGATTLSLALPVDGASAQRSKKDKKKKKSERPDVSSDFVEPFNKANDAIDAQDIATAEAQLAIAGPLADTPDENFFLGNATVRLGGLKNDRVMQRKGILLMLDSGKAPPENIGRFSYLAGVFAYENEEYPEAEQRFKTAIDSGFSQDNIERLYVDTIFRQNRTAEGLQTLKATVERIKASGAQVDEGFYRSGVRNSANAGLMQETNYWSQQWVANYPSATSWRDALTLFRQNASFPNAVNIDLMRLMRVSEAMVSEQDYAEYIENADPRALPGEVASVIEEGIAKGQLEAGNAFFNESLSMAKQRIPDDRGSLGSGESAARSSSNPMVALGTADAYLGYGEYAKAAELYAVALGKPGVDANLANTRLAIAQAMGGDYASARSSFAKVTGPRQPLAEFWTIWLDQQSATGG
ncbi:hypothetical protein [Alterisphingorhabdus coralli]|uniref:Tetratricopeptide repeat protein n=1 Tax=Alterisphingorhabdus coralli TaxID=3071408 RepID=A0AA97F4W4_9SPHN|nr:hypothetical protein [Parasphingorhabdus sp. SCSIO 66989]WOE74071.1 hypothetical protein RB602_09395 [Parasphingorhabdus sp. SCSIO 66989]